MTARPMRPTVPTSDVDVAAPTDLVRWGPIIAGIFAALSTLAALTVLGIAIGAASFDPGDQASSFGIGAGIWGAISALISFGVGGWLAARTAAVGGNSNGILNGAMVWFVTIPLLMYLLGSGIGALLGTAGSVVGTASQVAGTVAGQAANAVAVNPELQATAQAAANDPALQATAQAGAANIGAAAQATAEAIQGAVSDPQNQEAAANNVSRTAWGTLLSLGLAAAAAIGGGYVGARPRAVIRRA